MKKIHDNKISLKTFVVNLDDYQENYINQLPYLEMIGLHPERFSAINALKNEHQADKYHQYISRYARLFTPKSTIGCSLSHILLAHYINNKYIANCETIEYEFFLIMEDDAFPVDQCNTQESFKKKLNATIFDIEIIDKRWDIIQLHSDAPVSYI